MAIRTFDIESYTVRIHNGSGDLSQAGQTSARSIYLTSTAAYHDIRTRAYVIFFDEPLQTPYFGVVYNVDQLNYNGQQVYAFCRRRDFADWYDILRNEAPLKLRYNYLDDGVDQPNRLLASVVLFTGLEEPPGEGPEDLLEPILATLAGSAPATEGSDESTPASQ